MIGSRLTAALADRYRLERELGQGGMATVYLTLGSNESDIGVLQLKPR